MSESVFAPHAPTGFVGAWQQIAWVAVGVILLSTLPARWEREVPARDVSSDARPPGSWVLYGETLEVNGAAALDFERLPGIGPVLAKKLVNAREARGGFCSVAEIAADASLGGARWGRVVARLSVVPARRCPSSSKE